jgi:DNA-directed RNA polymerase specialized sigma24 family protein
MRNSATFVYVTKSRLKELVVEAQQTGVVSEELAGVLYKIGEGVWLRCRGDGYIDQDDFRQEVVVLVLRKLGKADPNDNLFNYFSTLAHNLLKSTKNRKVKEAIKVEKYREKKAPGG